VASDLCRVRTVRLRASHEDLVRRGAILLEDALRTASRPNSPGRRLLVVRSLPIGAIRASRGAANVALAVERKLHALESRAVHALDASAPVRDVVFFRDDVEAYAALAIRVAAQQPTDAWFWPLAVPVWRRGMPRDDALRALLFGVVETPAGASAGAALVAVVAERGALDALLGALRQQDGPLLLQPFGWGGGANGGSGVRVASRHAPALAPARMRVLERWVPRWGVDDARCTWLAGAMLIAERPVRVVDPEVRAVARALVVRAGEPRAPTSAGNPPRARPRRETGAATAVLHADAVRSARFVSANSDSPAAADGDAAPPHSPPTDRIASDERSLSETLPASTAPTTAPEIASSDQGAREASVGGTTGSAPFTRTPVPTTPRDGFASPAAAAASAPPDLEADAADSPRPAAEYTAGKHTTMPRPAERRAKRGDGERERARTRVAGSAPGVTARGPASGPGGADGEQPTAHAGLFFLLPLASRLGMPAFLAAHRELVELDFPTHLLRYVGRRLALDADDPVLATLSPEDDSAARWDGDFIAPDSWSRDVASLTGPWLVRPVAGVEGGDRRALTDGSWRLVLALWRDRAPPSVHRICGATALARGRPLGGRSAAMDILLGSWVAAMRRWCHRHVGMGLRALVTRPGRVAATRTHLDVYFDLRQIDIGVRRAGLDIDPGWLPWFGRVVAYHYGREERGDAR
jgi:hypothetical protein